MDWTLLAQQLFGSAHNITAHGDFLEGSASRRPGDHRARQHPPRAHRRALALAQARVVLDTLARHPGARSCC